MKHFLTVALTLGVATLAAVAQEKNFGEDVEFLKEHTKTFVLEKGDAKIAVTPEYQARVMTSTTGGDDGQSLGWINYELVSSGEFQKHINVFGGEDRFWLGPEGGQYAIFFEADTPYDLASWQTPAPIDTEAYELVKKDATSAVLTHTFEVTNRSGFTFKAAVERRILLGTADLLREDLDEELLASVNTVAYKTENTLRNVSDVAWTKETGLLSIWILGMYKPSPETNMAIPVEAGSESELGVAVNDVYFGRVPVERLQVKDNVVYFKGDGQARGKIGVSPARSKGVLGSYDPVNGVLTVVKFNQPESHPGYVNNLWEDQTEPFAGDAIMAYNDGPPEPGKKPLGPFYELETSSPGLPLVPGESYTHDHVTVHFTGPAESLDALSKQLLGVGIETIVNAL